MISTGPVMTERFRVLRLDEVDGYADEGRPRWHMIRTVLGNRVLRDQRLARNRARPGDHRRARRARSRAPAATRSCTSSLSGRATFTVDGERVAAPSGSLVYVKDPRARRSAVADEVDTTILVIGGRPGETLLRLALGALGRSASLLDDRRMGSRDRRPDGAARGGPGNANVLYNLACAESRDGRIDAALRAPRHGGGARAAVRGHGAGRSRSRRRSRRRPLPAGQPRRAQESPGSLTPAARSRKPGTGSNSGRATSRTAPCSGPASAPTRSSRPTASANALCALGPPKGTSSSAEARPASTSPCVTAPIETSTTIGGPSLAGNRDRERVRTRQRRTAVRVGETRRGRRREDGDEARLHREHPHPVAERARSGSIRRRR